MRMRLIDGDRVIIAQLYDDEHEEFIEKKMSIIDFINAYTDEGITAECDNCKTPCIMYEKGMRGCEHD